MGRPPGSGALPSNIRYTNGVRERRCALCQQWYPMTVEFFYQSTTKGGSGFEYRCRPCAKILHRKHAAVKRAKLAKFPAAPKAAANRTGEAIQIRKAGVLPILRDPFELALFGGGEIYERR